ncbi:cache domain-containing protein [Ferruginibacter paludis]|uniref:cache domain-containing protein n=1 Tax=Ferruginibacter paludis TaxID=1310417 RepID=UPI0025B581BE|nr:cache domain-containing protein [Ferruginibacter paludis]MDN3658035.1 cache domain-containing protein [Ferruginibacter paludis]
MRYFSFTKNYNDVLVTLLFLIFLGAGYFYLYVPQNEKGVQEQRFRSLQNIDKNIHAKIDNSIALMHNLLVAYKDSIAKRPALLAYIKGYNSSNFTLSVPDSQYTKDNPDSNFNIIVNNNSRQITLLATVQSGNKKDDSLHYSMQMKFTFEQFIKNLLPANVFDQYIVFSDGQVVYENFSSGIGFLNDSLSGKKGGITSSAVKSLNVSGKDYKLFFQPVSFTADRQLVVTGLLSNKHYQQEKNQLPSQGVLLLLTVVLITIVAYPWIKLYQMGNTDRLTVTDGIATIVVSMLLMSLLFFMLVKYNLFFKPDNSPDSKAVLATQITGALKDEIDSVYEKITSYDSLVSSDTARYKKDIVNLSNAETIADASGNKNEALKKLAIIAQTGSINQVYWLGKNGDEKINWISSDKNAPHGNFSQRAYFKNISQNKPYHLQHAATQPFYLDQIISWTTGTFTSVISIPSTVPGTTVAAMSFNMQSLRQPVTPVGYTFAMIDEAGKVLYHSDSARNLNENLLSELSENEKLRSCIEARTSDAFTSSYFSRDYSVSVQPVNNLPYFIVIFSDNSFKETRDVEIYSFTFSMMLLLFLFLVFQLFSVFLVSSQRSFFKRQLFDTSWVGPKISSVNQYNVAALTNCIVLVLMVIFFNFSSVLTYFFILFFSVIFTSLFLNSLFAYRYKKSGQRENYRFKITTIRWLYLFITLLNLGALRVLDGKNMMVFTLYELLIFFVGWLLLRCGRTAVYFLYSRSMRRIFAGNYAHSFTLMALTRLLLTSGLPILFFYVTAYNFEQHIGTRYGQLQYAKRLPATLTNDQLVKVNQHNNVGGVCYYYDDAWIKNIAYRKLPLEAGYTKEEKFTATLLSMFRIDISDKAVLEDKMYMTGAADSSFFYSPLLKRAGKDDSVTVTTLAANRGDSSLSITAANLNYRLPKLYGEKFYNGWLFWICLLLLLVMFYFIIYNVLKKLFCLDLPDLSLWGTIDDSILNNEKVNNLLFVIGLPGSGKLSQVLEKIADGTLANGNTPFVYKESDPQNNVVIADLINIPDIGNDREKDDAWKLFTAKLTDAKNKLIIVNHFEYNIQDAVTNRIKLNLLEQIMLQNTSKVIILSTIHPVAFLDSVLDQSVAEKGIPGQDLERWHVLLGHYRIVVFPLQSSVAEATEEYKVILKETAHTHFLNKMRECAMTVARSLPENERAQKADEMVFKLQVMSHYFYMYIWQSLTKEEKFLLYDLAEDNLVNSFDDYNLTMLLAKGVIIRTDGTLKLFNKGFRNFILTAIGNSEAMKIKRLIKDNGNWSRLKKPLMMVIVAILVFLLISQEEAYSKLITYIATLGAGIPALVKLFSIFDNSNSKS